MKSSQVVKSKRWEKIKLANAIEINPKRELRKGILAKKVSMDCLIAFNKKIQSFENAQFSGGSKFVNGDTIMARITPCLENGKTSFVDILSEQEVGFGSTEFIVLTGKEGRTTNDFVYYLVISPRLRKEAIKSMTGTSGRQRVQTDLFGEISISIPDIPEQNAIAKILSVLDAKIELNQQMNKTLEAIGQAIFKRWFIDFEFPNEKGKPYKNSGGEMVDSELGEMPKKWRAGKLREFVKLERGLSYKGKGLSESGVPMVNLGTISYKMNFAYGGLKYYSGDYKERNLVKSGDLIIANTDITQDRLILGSPSIVPPDLGNEKILFTHHIYAIRNNSKISNFFFFYLLKTDEYKGRVRGYATGTTVLALPEDAVLDLSFAIPEENILERFNTIINTIRNKMFTNIIEDRNLSQIRDSLLPRLMSGKIRVPVEVEA